MMADLSDLVGRLPDGDGRGGRRPGAGRKRADGTSKHKPEKPDFDIKTPEQLLAGEEVPPPLVDSAADDDGGGLGDADPGALKFTTPANPAALYAGAKARKEAALAAKAELEFRVKAGMYLPRDAIRAANARAFQSVSQTMRSLPDLLERRFGLQPEVTDAVSAAIDESLGDLAAAMEEIFKEANGVQQQD